VADYESLNPDEQVSFNGIMVTMISSHRGPRGLLEEGTLDAETFEISQSDLVCVMLCPGTRRWWEGHQHAYLPWGDYFNGLLGEWQDKQVPYTESFPSLRPAAAK
tara:strand:+ start:176 stop:490 length:315 start_codon:yes stop_codon:yes gene_type:complete